ncbi:MAG: hypothetical protein HQM16_00540 [Deltaproteobacteria bacterium]|nr:hypothetical protein [Deltaproteobacteria bacterium]
MKKHQQLLSLVIVCLAMLILHCFGGGGSAISTSATTEGGAGAVGLASQSLTLAEQVSVVDAQTTASTAISAGLAKTLTKLQYAVADLPADSDYHNDITFTYVHERSAEVFDLINQILCMTDQTQYYAMLNAGDYLAMIDTTQCSSNKDNAQSAGQSSQDQSSSGSAPEYELWTVNSYRETDTSGQVVSVWFKQEGSGDEFHSEPAMFIDARLEIEESASEANPLGIFTMNFAGYDVLDDGSRGPQVMTGHMRTYDDDGQIMLQFYNTGSFGYAEYTQAVTMARNTNGSAGSGTISNTETYDSMDLFKTLYSTNKSDTFNLAYNDNYFYRSNAADSSELCLSRAAYHDIVFRYSLYHHETSQTPGARLELDSGFPIKYNDGIEDHHGYVGYWGLWVNGDVSLESGDTVQKMSWGPGGESAEEEYELFVAGGKLVRHTRDTVTLDEIAGVPLNWGSCDQNGCTNYRVEWNATEDKLYKVAQMNETTWYWEDITPVVITFTDNDWDFGFWAESLGGHGRVKLRNANNELIPLTGLTQVIFYRNEYVMPGDTEIPASFACFENCIDPTAITTENPYFEASTWAADAGTSYQDLAFNTAPGSLAAGTNYASYSFNEDTMQLIHGTSDVVLSSTNAAYPWGIWMGTLIDPASFSGLACDWDANQTCTFKIWDLDEYYTWETGPENHQKLSLIKDANGTFVTFDHPVMVEYTHTTGAKYYLSYEGHGDLWGIPGKCINEDTGTEVNCAEGMDGDVFIRWVPEFAIANGAAVTDIATNTTYYVKALEREQQMTSVATSECTGAGLSLTTYDLPDASLYTVPNIGTQPTVTDAPAVIGGVLQVTE